MNSTGFYVGLGAGVFLMALFLLLAGFLARRLNPPKELACTAAHEEALNHLAEVIRAGAAETPSRALILRQLGAVLEILEYPKAGAVGDWEERTARMVYGDQGGEPTDPWSKTLAAFFEFARINLFVGFVPQANIDAYERVRLCLAALGLTARPATGLTLAHVRRAATGSE